MSVANKYTIEQNYIKLGNARSGKKIEKVRFLVAHEVGANSTADSNRKYFNNSQPSASAHTFIDNTKILEIVPLWEKAWHVNYDKPMDNQLFGDDANDCAIGVELCRTSFKESYDRYVWYFAYLLHKFNLLPRDIISHKVLDPQRRSDPESWLNPNGVTWNQFILDVTAYYRSWNTPVSAPTLKEENTLLPKAVVYNSLADVAIAEYLAERLGTVTVTRSVASRVKVAKELVVVGGAKDGLQADTFTVLSGADRFETVAKVGQYLKK